MILFQAIVEALKDAGVQHLAYNINDTPTFIFTNSHYVSVGGDTVAIYRSHLTSVDWEFDNELPISATMSLTFMMNHRFMVGVFNDSSINEIISILSGANV